MIEVIKISPFLNIGGQVIDVREFVDTIAKGSLITEKQIGSQTLPIPGIPENTKIDSKEREKIFQLLGHFAYLRFTPTPNNEQGSKFAYELVSKHQPEDMLLISKTHDRLGLGQRIVPKTEFEDKYSFDPDWMQIATFALIDHIKENAA